MNILYISAMSSPEAITALYNKKGRNPGYAMQKFHRLISLGLIAGGVSVSTLSALPAARDEVSLFCDRPSESYKGILYRYIPYINLPGLRQICFLFYTFFFVLFWGLKNRKNKIIIFDVLNISVCMGGLMASKINLVKTCGIMTDMPGLMVGADTIREKMAAFVNKRYLSDFDSYVFLTKAMEERINMRHRPYIIMEGLVDSEGVDSDVIPALQRKKSVFYAGGLYEKYGVKTLVDAFMMITDPDAMLDLYGEGDMTDYIKECSLQDSRINFHGVAPNNVVVEAEKSAWVLVNPRPSDEEFTIYSFPSKNMEYMLSGTPVATTPLPGMPREYFPFVFIFDDETPEGFRDVLTHILALSGEFLVQKGNNARTFVVENKNNLIQSARILNLLKGKMPVDR